MPAIPARQGQLAEDLGRSVSYVHLFEFVHRNTRPETIMLLRQDCASSSSATPSILLFCCLIGCGDFHSKDGIT